MKIVVNGVVDHGDLPWWEYDVVAGPSADGDGMHLANRIVETVQDIEKRQNSIFEGNRRHARIYAGYLPNGLTWGSSPYSNQRQPFEATKGLIRSVCDTATALISRFKPKPTFVTDNGDWKVQHQAEDLDQFMVGAYKRGGLYPVAQRCFHDSTVFGTGAWKLVPRGKGDDFYLSYERVLPDDLVIDEDECRDHLEPVNMYHRVTVRVDKLIKKYADGEKPDQLVINKLNALKSSPKWPTRSVPNGRCVLVEATHVDPDGKQRHVICVDGVTLVDETWPFDFHPYVVLWWAMPLSGFYGDGIAYRQYGRQSRITYLYRWTQRCHDLFATPRAWVDPAGGPPTLQMSNELGAIIMARKPPVIQVQQCVPPEIYRWLDELERGGYEDEGISQVSANNQLPPGLESAPAQREYSFKEGQRFAPVSQRWEDAVAVENATKSVAMYKYHVGNNDAKPKVAWADRRLMHTIEWPNLEQDAYVIHAEASSLDALSPSSRLQAAIELSQTGWLEKGEGRQLLGHPDLERSNKLDNAPRTYAEWVLRQLYKGKHIPVDDKADLAILDKVVRGGRLLALQAKSVPPTVMDALDTYLDELDAAMASAAQQMLPPPGAGGPNGPMAPSASQGLPLPFSAGPG